MIRLLLVAGLVAVVRSSEVEVAVQQALAAGATEQQLIEAVADKMVDLIHASRGE